LTSTDSFDLFGLPRHYKVDLNELEQKWKIISAQVHPDRFASASSSEKRVAVEWSTRVNEAYRVLKDPVKRAEYLCELAGVALDERTQAAMNIDFLENQMAWRESLDEARLSHQVEALKALQFSVLEASQTYETKVGDLLDQQQWQTAANSLREWMFIQKFLQEVTHAMRATRDRDRDNLASINSNI
jgi:molecular chaperone HscB